MIELRNKSNYNQNNNSIFLTQYNEENNLVIIIGLTDGIIRQKRDINIPPRANDIGTGRSLLECFLELPLELLELYLSYIFIFFLIGYIQVIYFF